MMRVKHLMMIMIVIISTVGMFGQTLVQEEPQSVSRENQDQMQSFSVGSSLWMFLQNVGGGESPYYGQLNFSYYVTPKDVLIVEGITWTYYEPLGTYGSSEEFYPGKVQAFGIGIGYQRFLWNGLYSSVLVTPFLQNFYDQDDQKIDTGFQLYLQSRLGYRFEFFGKRWFVEPSLAFNYWPINTNFPSSFKQIEEGAPLYKIETGLHFGFRF